MMEGFKNIVRRKKVAPWFVIATMKNNKCYIRKGLYPDLKKARKQANYLSIKNMGCEIFILEFVESVERFFEEATHD